MPITELVRRSAEKKIAAFCEGRVPTHARHQVRLEIISRGNSITIVERRAPWRPDFGPEWSTHAVARFRFEPRDGQWRLLWADRRGRWHVHEDAAPSPEIGALLEEVDQDPSGIFWG